MLRPLRREHSDRPAAHRRDVMLWVQIAGLLATSWIVWSVSFLPRLVYQSLASVISQALSYALLVCIASAIITLTLYLLVARTFQEDAIRMAVRTSSTAVWFAAATILLAQLSPATLPAALVLVVSTTRLLYAQWRLVHPDQCPAIPAPLPRPALDPLPQLRFRAVIPGLAASFSIQAGIAIFPMFPLLAAALFCLAVAMVTLGALAAGLANDAAPANLPRSILGFALTVILAAGLTVGGLSGSLDAGSTWRSPLQRPGPLQSARAILHKIFDGDGNTRTQEPVTSLYLPPSGNVEVNDDSFPGVILLPEAKPPQTLLIAPASSYLRTSPDTAPTNPVTIPFSGQYWMFRPPYNRPPRTSRVQPGNPLALSFRTTDHAPMIMEAYQKLDRPLDSQCCDAIQVEISNLDRYPDTIALELVLIDSSATASVSLGSASVASRPSGAILASERLEFTMPGRPRRFDVIKVIFHRTAIRREASARIKLENFVLLQHRD